eukprot:gb/GFBE01051910.1/.p1 GENE.gb/GFBE01051910.1/~~gb/GFBE01051910.1/.p1  ORF type:complete len:728 (+),score=199.44 gb/GFBE01051910.1/:1-2184(+)
MVLRYRSETDEAEVIPPKPRHLPPLDDERPSSSSGGAGGAGAEAGEKKTPAPSKGETEDSEMIARPAPPPGPKPTGAAPPKPGRHYVGADEVKSAQFAPARQTSTDSEKTNNVSSKPRFETRKSLAFTVVTGEVGAAGPRGYMSFLYRQAEQKNLWSKLDCMGQKEEQDDSRTRNLEMKSHATVTAISFKSLNTLAFDKIDAPDDEEEVEEAEAEEGEAEVVLKSVRDTEAVVRRQSAFILKMPRMETDGADEDKPQEEPGTGGSGGEERGETGQQGDLGGPGSSPKSAEPSKAVDLGPHPLKEVLTAKKVNVKEVRKVLTDMKDVQVWMEAPIDPNGKVPLPKPLVVAVAESNPALVELLVEFGADVTKPYTGAGMYKGWVKPGCSLSESVANRKGRFIGTMLADKLEKIEEIFAQAVQAAAAKAEDSVAAVRAGQAESAPGAAKDAEDANRHTIAHPKDVYEIMEHLGDGDTSTVWGGWHMETKLNVAIKTECKSDEAGIWDEISMMRKIRHPHICRLFETFENETQVFMVLELSEGGRLYDAVSLGNMDASRRDAARSPKVLRQLTQAVSYLHSNNICHRDIQLENFLVVEREVPIDQATLKLIDFTTAKEFGPSQELVTKICTPVYVSREILTRRMEPYTEKVDVWSLGVLFFILFSGHPPFPGQTDFDVLKKVKKAVWKFEPSEAWEDAPKSGMDLIEKMIVPLAEKRFSAQQVLEHPYLAE